MQVVNLSGRPNGVGSGRRRAKNLSGREKDELERYGWERLNDWNIGQQEAMASGDEADQFAVITVRMAGTISMKVYYLDDGSSVGIRETPSVDLKP
jgi:hypothetical protein